MFYMEQNQPLFSLTIEPITKAHLVDAAKWARFLAIAGMVLLAIALLFAFLTATVWANRDNMRFGIDGREGMELTTATRIGYLVFTIVALAVAFFPLLFLLQFSSKLRTALAANQQDDLNVAFQSLKKYFRYVGIILLIIVAIYALTFILAILAVGGR